MNRRTSVLLVALIIAVVGGALAIGLTGNKAATNGCTTGVSTVMHKIIIKNGKVSNPQVTGERCDTLTITNEDTVTREIAFGPHEHHVSYDGVAERVLNQSQSFTITLDKTGSYHWHDHLHDEVEGYFTVTQ